MLNKVHVGMDMYVIKCESIQSNQNFSFPSEKTFDFRPLIERPSKTLIRLQRISGLLGSLIDAHANFYLLLDTTRIHV